MTNDEARDAAKAWHGEAGGRLAPQLTENEIAGLVNEALTALQAENDTLRATIAAVQPEPPSAIGESSFETWYESYLMDFDATAKQLCRDGYAAGMCDPLAKRQPLTEAELRAEFAKWRPDDDALICLAEMNNAFAVDAIVPRHQLTAFKAGARAIEAKK